MAITVDKQGENVYLCDLYGDSSKYSLTDWEHKVSYKSDFKLKQAFIDVAEYSETEKYVFVGGTTIGSNEFKMLRYNEITGMLQEELTYQ